MKPFTTLKSNYSVLPTRNIDTDQIIPARFLKTIEQNGLGTFAFYDWRYRQDGTLDPDFVLNHSSNPVLVAGDNFGCGSSREHAPWALLDVGIRVVISTSIADIFKSNAQRNGLLVCQVDPDFYQYLIEYEAQEIEVNLDMQTLSTREGKVFHFGVDPFSRHCLLKGYDPLDYLLEKEGAIQAFEETAS